MNGDFGKRLAVEDDLGLGESRDEAGVVQTDGTKSGVQTNRPKGTENALLELSVTIRVLAGLDDGFLRLLHGASAHAFIAFRELMESLDSSMPVNTAFNSHRIEGLDVRNEERQRASIRRMQDLRAIQALLTLVLLQEKVTATVSAERELSASGSAKSLLCAAV